MTVVTMIRLLLILVLVLWCATPAQADVGGQIPGPGLCEYPGVGASGQVMNGYFYTCDFPTEENGSHWHCEWGGGVVTAMGGVNILMFNAGIQGYVGGVTGSCSWRCPDLTLAAQPNPPGAWNQHLVPSKCHTVGAKPPAPGESPPPAPSPDLGETSAVTNPQPGNPEATNNP